MELWIRSQDKLKLAKVGFLYVNKLNASDLDNRYEIGTGGLTLGIYETKERALEVLDEIQNIKKNHIRCQLNLSGCSISDDDLIYQMPKE